MTTLMSLSSQSFSIFSPGNFASCLGTYIHQRERGGEEAVDTRRGMRLSITHCRLRSILKKNSHLCNICLSPRQRLPFPQTPHDEIFLRSRHVRMQHTHISSQHHVHKASHSIKQRTSSIQVSNHECICTIQYLQMSQIGY